MLHLRMVLFLIPMATLAGCVSPAPPPPSQPPRPAATPAPAPPPVAVPVSPPTAAAWTERPLTPGTWVYRTDARGAVALYGVPDHEAMLIVRCDRAAQRIFISRPGTTGGQMTLRATTQAQAYPASPTGGSPSYIAAQLNVTDRQLDALAFSRGRFLVGVTGMADVIVPSWPEVARVIEECRG